MKKVINPGTIKGHDLFCAIEIENGKLSITGVVGPMRNGDAWGGCGQIDMEFAHRDPAQNDKRTTKPTTPDEIVFADGWTADKWLDFLDVWHKWHLNDMKPGCQHQRGPEWDTQKPVTVQRWGWGKSYHELRAAVLECKDSTKAASLSEQLAKCNAIFDKMNLHGYTSTGRHCWPDGAEDLLKGGFIEADKTENKTAGWVYPHEHPEGLLCKPCPVCGYKYGSEWRREELPAAVVDFLNGLPETETTPAWV